MSQLAGTCPTTICCGLEIFVGGLPRSVFLRQDGSLNLEVTDLARLSGQQATGGPPESVSAALGLWACTADT